MSLKKRGTNHRMLRRMLTALVGAIALHSVPAWAVATIYRSVGAGATTAIATGAGNNLTISGSTATFASAVPNNVGVGDAIQYDSDGNTTIDAIAFITGRTSSTVFSVQSKTGGAPTVTSAATTNWSAFRAYTAITDVDAGGGAENTGINAAVRGFDTGLGSTRDLVALNETWMISVYGTGTSDTPPGYWYLGWTTDSTHYVKVYAPASASEVGVSQRPTGTWDTSKYNIMTASTAIAGPVRIDAANVILDGLQIQWNQNSVTGSILFLGNASGNYQVTNCIIRGVAGQTVDFDGIDASSPASGIVKIWNNVIYDMPASEAIWLRQFPDTVAAYVYNNTIYNVNEGIEMGAASVIKNNIVQAAVTTGYGGSAPAAGSTNNVSNKADAPGANPQNSKTVTFVNAAGRDLRLAAGDTAAKDLGVNLSADANLPFAVDVEGQSRSGTWDIGADEYVTNAVTVSNLATSSVTYDAFSASVDYTGDGNANSACTLYYCNQSISGAACDPTTGTSAAMTRGASQFTKSISGLSPTNHPGDILNLKAACTDADGVTGSPLTSTVTLAAAGNVTVLDQLQGGSITLSGFTANVSKWGDGNANSSCTFYYCDNTASSGCDPTTGSSQAMTDQGSTYRAIVTGLTGHNPGHTYNVRSVCTDADGVKGGTQNTTVTLSADTTAVFSNLATSSVLLNGFTASVDFAGDTDSNAACTLYYCNQTDSAGCNPAAGTSLSMTRGTSSFTATVSGLAAPNDPGDVLNIRSVCTDADGVGSGGTLNSTVTLASGNTTVVSSLVTSGVQANQFNAQLSFAGDANSNAACTLYYCNQTDSPGCDAQATGASAAMARGSGVFTVSVTGLASPNDVSDVLNLKAVCTDADGISGSPLSTSITLHDTLAPKAPTGLTVE